jgi:hypothetical protein
MTDELFGPADDMTFGLIGVRPGPDSVLYRMRILFRGGSKDVDVELTGTAQAMIEVDPIEAVEQFLTRELNQQPNDVDWRAEIGDQPLVLHSKHVEAGIGRTN